MGVLEFPWTMAANIKPTRTDRRIDRVVARNVNAPSESCAKIDAGCGRTCALRAGARLVGRGHWRGVPLSGKGDHAFPSGHAIHVGALASAATNLPAGPRRAIWVASAGLLLARIVLLAHWTSDVIAGVLFEVGLKRVLRPMTGFSSFEL